MKAQRGLTLAGMALFAAGMTLPQGATAADVTSTEAPVAEDRAPETWGYVEFGVRGYLEEPPERGAPWLVPSIADPNKESSAKWEEYGDKDSVFVLSEIILGAQSADGEWFGEFRADDAFNNDQRFSFDWAKTGLLYGTVTWDQIPHLYSTSAQSIWQGVGTDTLTTAVTFPASPPTIAQYDAAMAANLRPIDIGIDRRRFSVDQRFTPTPNWDFKAHYMNDHRDGTQMAGVLMNFFGPFQHRLDMPRPIDDVTQNANITGEYSGKTPWGGKFNISAIGRVSTYENDYQSFTFQNPYYQAPGVAWPQFGRVSSMPDNEAYAVGATAGIDLPWNSRYMATIDYTSMRQDEQLIPYTTNPGAPPLPLPTNSPQAEINTLLFNNVLTTRFNEDITGKLRYRYYDLDNETPEWLINQYFTADGAALTPAGGGLRNLAYAYTKQNASAEVNWQAHERVSLGGEIGWERWDRDRRAANVTDEFFGKVTADAQITGKAQLRSSYEYAQRRYDRYDFGLVLDAMLSRPPGTSPTNATEAEQVLMRKFDMADRDRHKAKVSLEVWPMENISVTPTFGLRFDDYLTNPVVNYGLTKDNSWNAGVEFAWSLFPGTNLMLAYMYEDFDRSMVGGQITGGGPAQMTNRWTSDMSDQVHTIIAGANFEIIPGTLDLELYNAIALGNSQVSAVSAAIPCPNPANCSPFPNVTTNYNRFDASLNYYPDMGDLFGWGGDLTFKLKYAWERNRVDNWQDDLDTPYQYLVEGGTTTSYAMGAWNTNYDAHAVMASLVYRWGGSTGN